VKVVLPEVILDPVMAYMLRAWRLELLRSILQSILLKEERN